MTATARKAWLDRMPETIGALEAALRMVLDPEESGVSRRAAEETARAVLKRLDDES